MTQKRTNQLLFFCVSPSITAFALELLLLLESGVVCCVGNIDHHQTSGRNFSMFQNIACFVVAAGNLLVQTFAIHRYCINSDVNPFSTINCLQAISVIHLQKQSSLQLNRCINHTLLRLDGNPLPPSLR